MKHKNDNNHQPVRETKQAVKKKSGPVNIESTPITDEVKPKAGGTLRNEGTNIAYEEER